MKIICTADWHLRKSVPVCRTETETEWSAFQFKVIRFIFNEARQSDASVLCAGDLFDRPVPGTRLVNKLLDIVNEFCDVPFYISAGNHETPYHNHALLPDSAFDTIRKSTDPESVKIAIHDFNGPVPEPKDIALCHHLCFPDREGIPSHVEALTPPDIAKMYPDSSVIVCGDYHGLHSHFIKETAQYIIIPGGTTIQDAAYAGYSPSVLFLDTESLDNEVIHLPNDLEKISRIHIEKEQARNDNIDKFISMLQTKGSVSLSFSDNLKKQLQNKDIDPTVKNIIKNIEETVHGS